MKSLSRYLLLLDVRPTAAVVDMEIFRFTGQGQIGIWSYVSLLYINTAKHHMTEFCSDTVFVKGHLHISIPQGESVSFCFFGTSDAVMVH